ncbi:MAG: hypothetical protein IKK33_11250 [Lachnospiraceae bacterium]|nr:hypothetical protein [Lachnospiraceae bacterium]
MYERHYEFWNFPRIEIPKEDIELLVSSVNVDRLQNHPIALTEEDLFEMYTEICLNQKR